MNFASRSGFMLGNDERRVSFLGRPRLARLVIILWSLKLTFVEVCFLFDLWEFDEGAIRRIVTNTFPSSFTSISTLDFGIGGLKSLSNGNCLVADRVGSKGEVEVKCFTSESMT